MSSELENISICVSLLDQWEKYYEGTENGSVLKIRVRSLKNGLEFFAKLFFLSIDGNLANHVRYMAANVKHTLANFKEKNGVLDTMKLDHGFEDLRGMMMSLVINPGKDLQFFCMFQDRIYSTRNYERIVDLLLENISEVLSNFYINNNDSANDQSASVVKKVGELRMALSYYKPLYRCLADPSHLYPTYTNSPLDIFLNKAAVAIYLLLVGKMDEKIVVLSLQKIMRHDERCRKLNIYVWFLKFRSSEFSSDVKSQFYILDNLIHILEMNSGSLNDANNHLYVELRGLRTFVANQKGSERLNHFLGLTASTEAICYQAVPIVYSCYMEEVELEGENLNDILISVIGHIKMIKNHHGSQEIKLYDYPKVDCLGFLEFFLGHLKELLGHEQVSVIRNEIEALHTYIQCIVSAPKTSQEKHNSEGLWTHIVRLAYQAEYVMDLYLVIPNSRCISTLSNILEEVKQIKETLLALPDKRTPIEDVAITSRHIHGMPLQVNNVLIGFGEEIDAIKMIYRLYQ